MSIIINNVSEVCGEGVQEYELKINQEVKARFQHNFDDGLAVCLRKAAIAFEENPVDALKERVIELMKNIDEYMVIRNDNNS